MLAGSVEFPTRGEHLDNLQMIAQVMAELSGIPEKGGKIVEQLQLIVELMLEGFDAQCFEPFEHEIVDCAEQGEVGHEKEDAHEQDTHNKQRTPHGGRPYPDERNQQEGNLEQGKPYKILRSPTSIPLHLGGQPLALSATKHHEQYIEQNQMEAGRHRIAGKSRVFLLVAERIVDNEHPKEKACKVSDDSSDDRRCDDNRAMQWTIACEKRRDRAEQYLHHSEKRHAKPRREGVNH